MPGNPNGQNLPHDPGDILIAKFGASDSPKWIKPGELEQYIAQGWHEQAGG